LLGEHGGVDTAGELAQFIECGAEFVVGLGEQVGGAVCLRPKFCAGELEGEPEGEQSLLGAVVEVALEPAPFLVAGSDDPGT
jgi:hypothetical protein